ncbi:ATP-binding protein [Enemella sp. A6]|uniref:ATP-binding protein n=1 Tax=Enemella sp. A6 TaxID=3440152 RepID=UPI003EBCDB9E
MVRNPFTPTFGKTPPILAGRDQMVEDWAYAIDQGVGAPGRATLLTGARGVGKTVLLNVLEDEARGRGWVVISESTSPGLMDRLTDSELPRALRSLDPRGQLTRKITGITLPTWLGGGGVQTSVAADYNVQWDARMMFEAIGTIQAGKGAGLLITVDEIHRSAEDDLRRLTMIVQHMFREELPVAFVGAGLPSSIKALLRKDTPITFLRRAVQVSLTSVRDAQASRALAIPARDAGVPFDADALRAAAAASQGYPFLIQQIGYECIRVVTRDRAESITTGHVELAVSRALATMHTQVHETALAGLSEVDRTFLDTLARADGPMRTGAIAEQMGVTTKYAGVYRRRLIDAEIIAPAGYGEVDFELPYLREYLREQADD